MTNSLTEYEPPAELAQIAHRLEALNLGPRVIGGRLRALCAVHEADGQPHKPSFEAFIGRGGEPAIKCHAGCATRDVWRALKGDTDLRLASGAMQAVRPKLPHANVPLLSTWDDASPALGAWPPKLPEGPAGTASIQLANSYRYTDRTGEQLVAVRDRYHYLNEAGERIGKTFRQRVPVVVTDLRAGRDTVRWAAPSRAGVTLPLFGWPRLLDRVEGAPVYVCEGEKDALALHVHGLSAVTAPDGADGWKPLHTEQLRAALLPGEVVRLVGDPDTAGSRWRERLRSELVGVTIEEAGDGV
jgi:hypothetical protein